MYIISIVKNTKNIMKISSEEIKSKVSGLAKEISLYYRDRLVDELCIIVPMNGGVPFAVDLLREITNPGADQIFISYVFDEDENWNFSGSKPKKNSSILIIEDIYDTGETLNNLIDYLHEEYSPSDLQIVVMLDKKIKKHNVVEIGWSGFDVEDTWVYGYGMDDENGTLRQLSYISDEKKD